MVTPVVCLVAHGLTAGRDSGAAIVGLDQLVRFLTDRPARSSLRCTSPSSRPAAELALPAHGL